MKQLFKCKACGYITDEGTFRDLCPACGVLAKMMEPFADTLSPRRRMILTLHIHPVIVHAPQAIALIFVVVTLLAFGFENLKDNLFFTVQVLAVALPFVTVAAVATGIFDGKTRFRRIKTPILRKKIIAGVIYLLASIGLIGSTQIFNFSSMFGLVLTLGLSLVCFVCSFFLGKWGAGIINSYIPG
jgi:hypothetical protein